MRTRLLIAGIAVLLSSCQNMPEPYAPPVQRQPFEEGRPHRMTRIVSMSDGDWLAHVVQDIPPGEPGSWKWTGAKPTIKVVARTNQGLH